MRQLICPLTKAKDTIEESFAHGVQTEKPVCKKVKHGLNTPNTYKTYSLMRSLLFICILSYQSRGA